MPPPQSLLDLHRGTLRLGVPVPDVRPSVSLADVKRYGMKDGGATLHMPVLHVSF
jgi:hypothetical protein